MNRLWQKIGQWNWNKHTPILLIWVMYGLLYLILLSALGMLFAMVIGNFDMPRARLMALIPVLGHFMIFYSPPSGNHYVLVIGTLVLSAASWLFSTRLKVCTSSLRRRMFFFAFSVLTFAIVFNVFAANFLKPITYDKVMLLDGWVSESNRKFVDKGALKLLGTVLMLLPMIVTYKFVTWLYGVYREDTVVQEWFADYKFQWSRLARFGEDNAMKFPDITLAIDAILRVPVVLLGVSRQLGTLLIGPPGSGKTSLKIIKGVRQDFAHMQRMINAFPGLVKKHGLGTKEFLLEMGKYLIGTVVIEPAKDLCDKSYALAKEHGIPDRLVVYLDPSNARTPGFNCMIGPIEQVAETITAVLDGMSETSNEFFRQACRTVLKQYIYLLKFLKKNECTLLDLDQMYQDPRFTKDMVEEVRKKVPGRDEISRMPNDMQIYWMLVRRTLRWFDNDGLEEERDRDGMLLKYETGEHQGRIKIKDKQSEFTRQTRNLLADLITNPYLARILTGRNEVDLDKLMGKGGVLLCNTDNGLLGNVSDAFGKLVLMSVQNAVFRRKGDEDTRPLVSVYVDEFYDYMNSPFLKLAGQGRKYKVAFLVACQSLSQFHVKFNEAFVNAMLGTIRNYIVYGGVGEYDAKKLVPIFGTHVVEEVADKESFSPESNNNPSMNYSRSVVREERELVTANEIMFNKFKFSYMRLIVEGSTSKAVKGEGDFVDFGDAEKWKKALQPEAVKYFMQYWQDDNETIYTFDMNWIDTWGDHIDPNTKDVAASLEKGYDKVREEKTFEEIARTDDTTADRFVDLELSGETAASRQEEDKEVTVTPMPRASQFVYHKGGAGEVPQRGIDEQVKTSRPEPKKDDPGAGAAKERSKEDGTKESAVKTPPANAVSFSSVFSRPASPSPMANATSASESEPVQEKETEELPVAEEEASSSSLPVENRQDPSVKKKKIEYLKDAGVDVNSKKFLQQLFNVTRDDGKS